MEKKLARGLIIGKILNEVIAIRPGKKFKRQCIL
jgi:hypothetical protein